MFKFADEFNEKIQRFINCPSKNLIYKIRFNFIYSVAHLYVYMIYVRSTTYVHAAAHAVLNFTVKLFFHLYL